MKKLLFLIAVATLGFGAAHAQPINRATPEALLKAAEESELEGNLYGALQTYEDIFDETKDKAVLVKIAQLNYRLRDYEKAERNFSRLVLRDRKGEYTELKYWYAMAMKQNGKYAEAIDAFNEYISSGADEKLKAAAKIEIAGAEQARKAPKQPDNLLIANAGKKVNRPQTESTPNAVQGTLYFAALPNKEEVTLDGKEDDWYSKIFTAQRSGTEYGDPTPLGENINREGWHQGNVSITPDGRTMYFTRAQLDVERLKESKIYYAIKGSDGNWGAANEVSGVNTDSIVKHPCEGELFGEKVLFFVANMPGGKGGDDIYYAPKKGDGQFGLPVNLGDVINTVGDESSPFYRDGKLFFSSNGRETYGGYDVFESQWNGSVWSAPKNLGMGVNSSVDDIYYTQASDGMSGFFVSNRPGSPNSLKSKTCCDDIYTWEIERVKVTLLARTFRFKRKGEKENQPLTAATVQIQDVSDRNPVNVESKTNASGNEFTFDLQPEKTYRVIATRDGYISDSLTFNTLGIKKTPPAPIEKKLTLHVVKKEPKTRIVKINEPIRLNNIYYDFDDDKILPKSEPDLQFLYDLLIKYPDMKIELSSHTDSRGKDDYNMDLSQRRANSARKWLLDKGIAADRIVPKGYGETQLQNGCTNGVECTEEQHQLNRRTEFKILSGPTSITIEREEKVEE